MAASTLDAETSMHARPAFPPRRPAIAVHLARACTLAAALAIARSVPAQQPAQDGEGGSSWGLGIVAMSKHKPYAGMDRENKVIPFLQFENDYLRVFGPGLEAKLPGLRIDDAQRLNFGLLARFDASSGYEAGDSRMLAGMAERKGGFWAGAKVEWETGVANLSAEWLRDASGHSRGQTLTFGLERTWQLGGQWMLTPRLAASWQDRKVVDYYFGVRGSEARGGRPAYHGGSGVNTEAGLRAAYLFDRHHSVFLDVGVTSLASSIRKSPLVDRSSENQVLFGYVYRFR